MMTNKNKLRCFMLGLVLIGSVSLVEAQPTDPNGDPDAIPFDGGISAVVVAGIAYAAKKGYIKRKKQQSQNQSTD